MAFALSTDDLARLEAANRALLSPLDASGAEAWLLEVGHYVRDLIGGDRVILTAPGGPSGLYSADAPDVAAACSTYVAAITTEGWRFTDPVVDAWHNMRRAQEVEAFSWDINERMVETAGHQMLAGPIVGDALVGHGYRDFAGLMKTTSEGDAMVWVLGRERGGLRFGQATPMVLQTLVPAFRAGLDSLGRLGTHRLALDVVAEPLAAFDADGREVYRNAALVRLVADEPAPAPVEGCLRTLARDVCRLAFPRRGQSARPPVPMERVAATARGRYTLRATLLPAGALGQREAALVSVAADVAPPRPTAEDVRGRFGLTPREADVALLLAEGLKNDEIADRLFIASGTARRHTEAVLAKLEAPTRAAVAAKVLGR